MKLNSLLINITSENPDRLRKFYQEVVGLVPDPEMGDSMLVAPGVFLGIAEHNETHGMTKEPQRVLIDFFVEDEEVERVALKAKDVAFAREAGVEWWGGIISTFADPDGNLCQIIQYDPSRATENPDEVAQAEVTA